MKNRINRAFALAIAILISMGLTTAHARNSAKEIARTTVKHMAGSSQNAASKLERGRWTEKTVNLQNQFIVTASAASLQACARMHGQFNCEAHLRHRVEAYIDAPQNFTPLGYELFQENTEELYEELGIEW